MPQRDLTLFREPMLDCRRKSPAGQLPPTPTKEQRLAGGVPCWPLFGCHPAFPRGLLARSLTEALLVGWGLSWVWTVLPH